MVELHVHDLKRKLITLKGVCLFGMHALKIPMIYARESLARNKSIGVRVGKFGRQSGGHVTTMCTECEIGTCR